MARRMRKIAAGACAAGVVFALSGCTPAEQTPEAIYGPPEDATSPAFDPSDNGNEDVYGPPVGEWDTSDGEFDPSENEMEALYGPPADEVGIQIDVEDES